MEQKLTNLRLKVCERQCSECLFGKNRIVSLARKKEIIQLALSNDQTFICHNGTIAGQEIVCRGFYDRISTNKIRMAQRLELIEFINPLDIITNGKNKK